MIRELLTFFSQLFTWLIIVAPWEQALRIRLGRDVTLLEGGWYIRIPFIDRLYRQSIRRRLTLIRALTITTKDFKVITMGGSVGYSIKDIVKLYNSLHNPIDTIEAEVSSKISTYIATHDFIDCNPSKIEEEIRKQIDLTQYGLGRTEFYITNFATVKTYRIISGELPSYARGSDGMNLEDEASRGSTPR